MIIYKQGNLLDVKEGIIAHGCNAKGVMGSGVAKCVKAKYPEAYFSYVEHCRNTYTVGTVDLVRITSKLWVANCITQYGYGRDPKLQYANYDAIRSCMQHLARLETPLHIPKIGAGLGNGDWDTISSIIERIYVDEEVTCWEL